MSTDRVSPASGANRQAAIDWQNQKFWDELCGSQAAKLLGVTDSSPTSLAKFDTWYMDYYPYLAQHIPFAELKGKKVLEVGLGYGTVSQRICEAGADYRGLDIAAGPVHMVNHRISQSNLKGCAVQGSMLECPFPDNEFDWLIAIGCFHHTGNLQRALDEAWRVLKPASGRAMVMVYYAYSYRRWVYQPRDTFKHFLGDKFGIKTKPSWSPSLSARYDTSTKDGVGAPETAFTSVSDMRRLTVKWSGCRIRRENIGQEFIFRTWQRTKACRTAGPLVGLDIYCDLTK